MDDPTTAPDDRPEVDPNQESLPIDKEEAKEPETSDEYDRVFGKGGAVTDTEPDEEIYFDPSEAITSDLPPGRYVAEIIEPPIRQMSSNNNPMMTVTFQVVEGEYRGALQWRRYMLQGKGGGWTKQFLQALGLKDEAAGKKPIQPSEIKGKRCLISVRPQRNNPDYNEVYKVEAAVAREEAPF